MPLIAGTIHSDLCIRRARKLPAGAVDLLELRVDHFAMKPERLLDFARNTSVPLIITVRAQDEGGAIPLSSRERIELFLQFLPWARFVDLELRAIGSLQPVVTSARAHGAKIIASHHDFRATPSAQRLAAIIRKAHASRADITKIAAHAATLEDLVTLLLLFSRPPTSPLSVMAMGPWGKAARLLLARAGSVLNYGYIGKAQVPGQWQATTFKSRVLELFDENTPMVTPARTRRT
jgi:3-dehydroquinate dehydratase-1